MSTKSLTLFSSVLAIALLTTGCGDTKTKTDEKKKDDHHGHAHPSAGPHDGLLIELGNEEYHGEMLHDEATNKITIYILDGAAKEEVKIAEDSVSINTMIGEEPKSFALDAVDAANGMASHFEITDESLATAIDMEGVKSKLKLTIDGKQFTGSIEEHDHDH